MCVTLELQPINLLPHLPNSKLLHLASQEVLAEMLCDSLETLPYVCSF